MVKYLIISKCVDCNIEDAQHYDMDKLGSMDNDELVHAKEVMQKQIGFSQQHANHLGFIITLKCNNTKELSNEIKKFSDSLQY